jgi:hypothetical protein
MSSPIVAETVGYGVGSLAFIQLYHLIRLITGDTPYIGKAIDWLPSLINNMFGVFAWLPLVIFAVLLYFKDDYVKCSKQIVWRIIWWTFTLHVLMLVIQARTEPNSLKFIGGLLYCIFACMSVFLTGWLG